MRATGELRARIGAAALAAIAVVLLGSALPAAAGTKTVKTGVYADRDAKLSLKVNMTRAGKPKQVKGISVSNYDLDCYEVLKPENRRIVEVGFSFAPVKVKREKDRKYRYSFAGEDEERPFPDGFSRHYVRINGWFATSRSGKVNKLAGYLTASAFTTSVPGLTPPIACSDPSRQSRFEKIHGSFSASIR